MTKSKILNVGRRPDIIKVKGHRGKSMGVIEVINTEVHYCENKTTLTSPEVVLFSQSQKLYFIAAALRYGIDVLPSYC